MFARRCYVLRFGLALTMCMGLSGAIANDECNLFGCPDDCEFTMDFRLQDCCWFRTIGINPYFKLIPGYQLVLETPEGYEERERVEVTVLWDTETIDLRHTVIGKRVRTRVVEEREYEIDGDEEVLIEVSRNFFAICQNTNAVYYFGEDSRACESGFTEDETMCEGENGGGPTPPDTEGSWRAGEPVEEDCEDAFGQDFNLPGLIMPGTYLLRSTYFQELAPCVAMDRGENLEMVDWPEDGDVIFTGCGKVLDTNPLDGECGQVEDDELKADIKIYCPGVGLVQDEDLELVCYGFHCDD